MMNKKTRICKNCILPLLAMGISAFVMGVCFDFYYDLNDDTLMRDIMSGIYSGTPDGHNMQTLYPLGAMIALCYRVVGSFPWYGVFLLLCQFGCFFAVGARLCTLADTPLTQRTAHDTAGGGTDPRTRFVLKPLILAGVVLFQWGIWLTHMVNVQYTITCGMLVGAAVFLLLTAPDTGGESSGAFSGKAALLLFLLAFQLRSEMALLLLPFPGLAGAFCWWEDRPVFTGKNLKKYGGLFLLLLAGMGISLAADSLAYGGEWKAFRQFFDDRTTIYDFYPQVVTDDSYRADLENLGVSFADSVLLRNYNFGLDEKIDAQMLSDAAAYAQESVGAEKDWSAVFREKLRLYRYRSFHKDDAPYNLLVVLGYVTNIIAAVMVFCRGQRGERWRELFGGAAELSLIFLVRSALWMFILMRGRDPERITHPLYLAEFALLAGMFLRNLRRGGVYFAESGAKTESAAETSAVLPRPDSQTAYRYLLFGAAVVICLLSAAGMTKTVLSVQADQARRQEINRNWEAIDAYCRAHPDTFYFEDVYSTVAFSGKLLECRDNEPANYDIAGGWMCKSPLYQEKLAAFGIGAAADALAEGRADFIMSDEEVNLRGLTWLTVIYTENDLDVSVEEYDRIGQAYGVYQVIPVSERGEYLREIN